LPASPGILPADPIIAALDDPSFVGSLFQQASDIVPDSEVGDLSGLADAKDAVDLIATGLLREILQPRRNRVKI
jgi:hypothetical protein